jgi:hypothetical protein
MAGQETTSATDRHVLHWCFLVGLQDPDRCSELDRQADEAYNMLMAVARSPTPEAAAANSAADQQQEQPEEPEEQLFAVYLPPSPEAAPSGSSQFVELLRLPKQAEEHSRALQQGMQVLLLPGAAERRYVNGVHIVSAEQLAWEAQQERAKKMDVSTVSSTNDSMDSAGSNMIKVRHRRGWQVTAQSTCSTSGGSIPCGLQH